MKKPAFFHFCRRPGKPIEAMLLGRRRCGRARAQWRGALSQVCASPPLPYMHSDVSVLFQMKPMANVTTRFAACSPTGG